MIEAWLLLPSLLMVTYSFSSFAVGMLAVALSAIIVGMILKRTLKIGMFYLPFIFASFFSSLVSLFFFDQPLNFKIIFSLVVLFVIGVGATYIFRGFNSKTITTHISNRIKKFYLFLVLIGIFGAFFPIRLGPYAALNHPVFPFIEPSHYALVYAPIACMAMVVYGSKARILICLVSFALALSLPNTTLLMVTLLLLLLIVSIFAIFLLVVVVSLFSSFLFTFAPDLMLYFSERITGDNSENLSRLVYIQGWENMFSALSFTSGLGLGFQNFGSEPPGPATLLINLLTDSYLNRADGGFLLAKVGGEFGIFGIIIVALLVLISISSGYILRKTIRRHSFTESQINILPLCAVYPIIIELIIRGTGYFSPSLILSIYFLPMAVRLITLGEQGGHSFWRIKI